jgi:hypothetical protein
MYKAVNPSASFTITPEPNAPAQAKDVPLVRMELEMAHKAAYHLTEAVTELQARLVCVTKPEPDGLKSLKDIEPSGSSQVVNSLRALRATIDQLHAIVVQQTNLLEL